MGCVGGVCGRGTVLRLVFKSASIGLIMCILICEILI